MKTRPTAIITINIVGNHVGTAGLAEALPKPVPVDPSPEKNTGANCTRIRTTTKAPIRATITLLTLADPFLCLFSKLKFSILFHPKNKNLS
jgi:hypothetical protein